MRPGAGRGGAFDAANGRDHRNFPPDPQVAYRSMRRELDFPDLVSGKFTGVQRLRVAPIGMPVRALRLDATGAVRDVATHDSPPERLAAQIKALTATRAGG